MTPTQGHQYKTKMGRALWSPRHKCSDGHKEIDAGQKLSGKDANGPGKVIIRAMGGALSASKTI